MVTGKKDIQQKVKHISLEQFTRITTLVFLLANSVTYIATWIMAAGQPDYSIIVTVNRYGEVWLEAAMMGIGIVLSIPGVWLIWKRIQDDRDNSNEL